MDLTSTSRIALVTLCLAAVSAEPRAAGDEPAAFKGAARLSVRLQALYPKEPDLKPLFDLAIAKAGKQTLEEFLSTIRFCDPMASQYGAMKNTSEQNIIFLGRVLEEPAPGPDNAALKAFYLERFKDLKTEADTLQWQFEPDLIVLSRNHSHRDICLKPDARLETSLDAVAHETYHYVRIMGDDQIDILAYKDLDDYATYTILRPGEEIDAYVFQYGLAIRRDGKAVLGRSALLTRLFGPGGEFIGRREDLVPYVLDELGYRDKRFREEYLNLLNGQLARAEQRQQILTQLLKTRRDQQTEFLGLLSARRRFLGFFWPAYAAETKRLAGLAAAAQASIERLTKSQTDLEERTQELQLKSAAVAAAQ